MNKCTIAQENVDGLISQRQQLPSHCLGVVFYEELWDLEKNLTFVNSEHSFDFRQISITGTG